jgi:nucleotide-binding universal stress UspA family protein
MPRVVVGVDGSAGARNALELAVQEARLRGAVLHAVHAWRMPLALALPEPTIAGFAPVRVKDLDRLAEQLGEEASRLLHDELQTALGDDSGLEVKREVVEANPAEALIDAARGADLLVVGSRGRGGFKGLLLGSVGQHVAHYAPCPVLIVPHDREEGAKA